MRVFYWAAFHGFNRYLKYMVLHKKWSPFIKSFRNRSIVSGAIWGENLETIRLLVGQFKYENTSSFQIKDFARTVFNKDEADNNCLHYSYMIDMPEVREILRENNIIDKRAKRLNRRGQLPTQLRHFIKAEDSNEETEDEEMYAA